METIRSEIAQLRTNPLRVGGCNSHAHKLPRGYRVDRDTCWQGAVPALTDPTRIKKLASFFGDEPPLLRIFLKKLGYEVSFEKLFQYILFHCFYVSLFLFSSSEIRATV